MENENKTGLPTSLFWFGFALIWMILTDDIPKMQVNCPWIDDYVSWSFCFTPTGDNIIKKAAYAKCRHNEEKKNENKRSDNDPWWNTLQVSGEEKKITRNHCCNTKYQLTTYNLTT